VNTKGYAFVLVIFRSNA